MACESETSRQAIENLDARDVHVWLADPDASMGPGDLAGNLAGLLDPDETERLQGFHFERDRRIYLCAHVLLRTRLSRYAPIEPERWGFLKNAYGRPEISAPVKAAPLRFNISHTHGLVACALTRHADIGVDVEDMSRGTADLDVAKRFFAPPEYDMLRRAPDGRRREMFYTIWTLKEAYIKARGLGLSLPLDSFFFDLSNLDAGEIGFHGDLDDEGAAWRFHVERVGTRHMLALAVGGNDVGDLEPLVRHAGSRFW